jgi:polyphosphate kinase 2
LIDRSGEYLKDVHPNVKVKTISIPIEFKFELLYGNKLCIKKLLNEKYFLKAITQIIKVLFYKLIRKKRDIQFLIKIANKILPTREERYDLAVDFQGLGSGIFSTFYISEKVLSDKKATWIHQDISFLGNNFNWVDKYYHNFDKIDIPVILRELNNEFTEEFVKELNIEPFLRKLNQILELRKRNTKKKIREEFDSYYQTIESRIDQLRNEPDESFGEIDPFEGEGSLISRKQYEFEKYYLQAELLKLQEWIVKNGERVAIVFEGRDAAGKGSTIKRFIEYLNPKGFRVVALGVPTEEEKNNWFERYEKHLPKPGEIVFFDRSWYNRAVVEPAMGYCTEEQYQDFMTNVVKWEEGLMRGGMILIKFWFSITKEKQALRFELRKSSPLKYWKFSPNDAKVLDKWEIITNFKNQMFSKTSSRMSPWVIINSNDKKIGRLNAIR